MTKQLHQTLTPFIHALRAHHIPVSRLFVFGSAARGTQHAWSDIDVGVVGQAFGPDRFDELVTLYRIAQDVNPAISPVPLRPEDLNDHFSTIAEAIRREGQEVPLED